MRRRHWMATLCGLTLLACSSPAPPSTASAPPPKATQTGPSEAQVLSFATAELPASLQVDGALGEWAATPSNAALTLALDERRLAIAVRHFKGPRIHLMVAAAAPTRPSIGWIVGPVRPLDLSEENCRHTTVTVQDGDVERGPARGESEQRLCRELMTKQAAVARLYYDAFRVSLTITAEGVFDVDGKPVHTAFASGDDGMEMTLPLTALPRLGEAPWKTVFVAASPEPPQPQPAPPRLLDFGVLDEPPGWTRLTWVSPVSFGRYPKLNRAGGFRRQGWRFSSASSYHPSRPNTMVMLDTPFRASDNPLELSRPAVVRREIPVFDEVGRVGEVRVGWNGDYLHTVRGDDVIDNARTPGGPRRHARRVGSTLHVYAYAEEGFNAGGTHVGGEWNVFVVDDQGGIGEPQGGSVFPCWTPSEILFDESTGAFGFRHTVPDKPNAEQRWTWNANRNRYDGSVYQTCPHD